MNHIHHVHIFASDLAKSMEFYQKAFGGEVVLDVTVAGARNVFMKIGKGGFTSIASLQSIQEGGAFTTSVSIPTSSRKGMRGYRAWVCLSRRG